jgi:hypothetical protein
MTTFGVWANAWRNSSRPCTPAPTTAALPDHSPGPLYFFRNLTSLKLWVLMIKDPKPVERPLVFVSSSGRSVAEDCYSHEVVASVTNDQTQVALSCKVHTSFQVLLCLCHNNILSIKAARTWLGWIGSGQASVVGGERPKVCNGMVGPSETISSFATHKLIERLTAIARWPNWLECLRTLPRRTR